MNNIEQIAIVVSNDNQNVTIEETIHAIKNAGFQHVFVQWYNKEMIPTQEEQLEIIRNSGLIIDFAHLGYKNINSIWETGELGDLLVSNYINDLKNCKKHGISHVCMHLTSKSTAPAISEIGLKRIQQITNYAKELNMTISFENTKIKGYVEAVLDFIQDSHVGFCFDSGHYHAHFQDELKFSHFYNRILSTHLHDNHGIKDEHLLPFEGTLDWQKTLKELKSNNYQGRLTLELVYRNEYCTLSIDEFYRKGFDSAIKLTEIYEEIV